MTSIFEENLRILADPEALSICVAGWILDLAAAKEGIFSVCLSGGGSTPQRLYEHLAAPRFAMGNS
jgi:hypothetical protein